MTPFNALQFIKRLSALGERQLETETQAANLIRAVLNEYQLNFVEQKYLVDIPRFVKHRLLIDDERIDSLPTGLVSGAITKQNKILSSLISSQLNINDANINYSEVCPTISKNNFYHAPALAINFKDLDKIKNAITIKGEIEVERANHEAINFLIGNIESPKHILFCHYDSWGPGAIDNASGTALLLKLAICNRAFLDSGLFVIAANEEISYDYPVYWGHGYRVFENLYRNQMIAANQLIVVDCVGHAHPVITQEEHEVLLGFPIKDIKQHLHKTKMIYADLDFLMTVYHSKLDLPDNIKPEFLHQTYRNILELIA